LNSSLGIITFIAAIGSGLIAGVFFAFSTFIMSAFARLQPSQGITAMQFVNITVINYQSVIYDSVFGNCCGLPFSDCCCAIKVASA
jgi:uncharacterized membrane protein